MNAAAASQGKRYLFRTGAAFVSARLGISPISPISAAQLRLDGSVGGLIVAGSYVPKTTAQLDVLINKSGESLTQVILDVEKLLASPASADEAVRHAVQIAEEKISNKQDVLVMTSRKLITGHDERSSLDIGTTVAKALVDFTKTLSIRPRYLIAKVSYR